MAKSKGTKLAFILIIVGILIIIIWALGKAFGWIHSPSWVNTIPVFGGAVTLGGIGIAIGKILQKLERVLDDVEKIKDKTSGFNDRLITLETKVSNQD